MSTYLKKTASRVGNPNQQDKAAAEQVKNSSGAYVFPVTDWIRLDRFLILGTEKGCYYASEQAFSKANAEAAMRCIEEDGLRVVQRVVEISQAGRAPKNEPALFVLALCAAAKDGKTRATALDALPKVARIGTHLFHFAEYVNSLRGWGRGLRKAVAKWYTDKDTRQLQNQLLKYQSRDGWGHRDMMRLAHPQVPSEDPKAAALRWAVGGMDGLAPHSVIKGKGESAILFKYREYTLNQLDLIAAFEEAKAKKDDPKAVATLIRQYQLTREMVPTEALNSKEVWEALLEKMPMTAMIRNLANMTRNGLIAPMSETAKEICNRLRDQKKLQAARVHPVQVLLALTTYQGGHGFRSQGATWSPVQQVVDALDDAFYLSFGNVRPTNKNWYLGVDVSSSMSYSHIAGSNLTANQGAAALSMVTARVEQNWVIKGFCHELRDLKISPKDRLDTVVRKTQNSSFGSTDCSAPMEDALRNKIMVDVFCVLTDSETNNYMSPHPFKSLQNYRQKMGIPAKLIVVGMTANEFTIASPDDAGMLDCIGFDAATPNIMSSFAVGETKAEAVEEE